MAELPKWGVRRASVDVTGIEDESQLQRSEMMEVEVARLRGSELSLCRSLQTLRNLDGLTGSGLNVLESFTVGPMSRQCPAQKRRGRLPGSQWARAEAEGESGAAPSAGLALLCWTALSVANRATKACKPKEHLGPACVAQMLVVGRIVLLGQPINFAASPIGLMISCCIV
jgi:hypothetical protein